MTKVPALVLSSILAASACCAQADIYRVVSADGGVTLTNIHRTDRKSVRVARERPLMVRTPAVVAPKRKRPQKPTRYALIVAQAAFDYDLPAELLHAVIKTESNYDPTAVSPKGAAGLMQLMPETARDLGVRDVFDPAANVRGGARYLKRMMTLFGNDLSLALAAYNAGPGAVLAYDRAIPPYPETQRYVPSVLGHYQRLQAEAKRPR
ncbi:lytic transglycosylase domain-containing protein [Pseudomonas sp. BN417]|uniref:lytic transglycosylase domain-containing protein n=1 Tax=Pseudomonas sp. BN417 TaxID=2567890 RepID=UPI0024582AC7|nr:lytic transglycosylase domain-containing protein [Pseudomonas sp. BN417]MDH4556850.1 lytic transglycosylase domain-containing protein [Pseudomonas sp. BN417]